ncbi:hypothetical protein ACRAWG_32530 [Methylobacterium sp. P31]
MTDLARDPRFALDLPTEISPIPLYPAKVWAELPAEIRDWLGQLLVTQLLGGHLACLAEFACPAASRAGITCSEHADHDLIDACAEKLLPLLRDEHGWKIPASIGPVCRRCGCSENDACEGGCGWVDNDQTLCTACAGDGR